MTQPSPMVSGHVIVASRPELFKLTDQRKAIERTVVRRDGHAATTKAILDQVCDKQTPSQDYLAALFDRQFLRSTKWPQLRRTSTSVRLVDLFSGCGIMSLGVWEACRAIARTLEPVMAIDSNETALQVYQENFPTATA